MGMLMRVPHGFLRRHLSTLERVMVAAVFGVVLYQLMESLPVYPEPWPLVVAATVVAVQMWSPPVAFYLAVIAVLAPLYSISLYVAVLFLAVALLGQRVFIHNLGATLLVLLAPWLAQYHLEWLPVLLGGLWWGKIGGAWMGGLAALWGQTLFGMTGTNPDWIAMMGTPPAAGEIAARFGQAGSLETLQLLVTPLAPDPTLLLYHLLQVVLWAMAGGLIGGLAEGAWTQRSQPWRAIAVVLAGAAALLAGHAGLAGWLEQFPGEDFAWIVPGLFESALYAGLLAALLEAGRDFVERPLAFGRRQTREASFEPSWDSAPMPVRPLARQAPPARQARQHPMGDNYQPGLAPARPDGASARRTVEGLLGQLRGARPAQPTEPVAGPGALEARASAEGAQTSYPPVPVPTDLPRRDAKKQRPDDIIKIELD